MQDRPTREELLEAVETFLRDTAMAELEGRSGFHARVAANVVAIVRRELELGERADEEQLRGLRELLRRDGELRELEVELCRRIRQGEIDWRDAALLRHLRATTMAKLAIDNPRYAGYRRHLEERAGGGGAGRE